MEKTLEFIKANLNYFILAAVIVALALIVIIVVICISKAKRNRAARDFREIEGILSKEVLPAPVLNGQTQNIAKPTKDAVPQMQNAETELNNFIAENQVSAVSSTHKTFTQDADIEDITFDEDAVLADELEKLDENNRADEKQSNSAQSSTNELLQEENNVRECDSLNLAKKETKVKPKRTTGMGSSGKWQVKKKSDDDFYLYLIANNGSVLLSSEAYTTADGAKRAVDTIKKNVAAENFTIYCDKNGSYYYKLKTTNNRLLCVGESYGSQASCLSSIDSVKKFCDSAIFVNDIIEEMTEITYKPTKAIYPAKEGYEGKWVLKEVGGMYLACLYASNGEMILAGESYSSYDAAKKSIANIIKNALEYNFIIDKNKNSKFYYKLRTPQRNVICVGEVYDTQSACVSAIESVIRFCSVAKITN